MMRMTCSNGGCEGRGRAASQLLLRATRAVNCARSVADGFVERIESAPFNCPRTYCCGSEPALSFFGLVGFGPARLPFPLTTIRESPLTASASGYHKTGILPIG